VKFEAFTAIKIQVAVSWIVTPLHGVSTQKTATWTSKYVCV